MKPPQQKELRTLYEHFTAVKTFHLLSSLWWQTLASYPGLPMFNACEKIIRIRQVFMMYNRQREGRLTVQEVNLIMDMQSGFGWLLSQSQAP